MWVNNGMVCLRSPHPSRPGVRISRVWQVEATHNAVAQLAYELVEQLLSNPTTTYRDLGADYHTTGMGKEKLARRHIQQLHALGYQATLKPAT